MLWKLCLVCAVSTRYIPQFHHCFREWKNWKIQMTDSVRVFVRCRFGRGFKAQIHASDDENRLLSTNVCEKSNYFHFSCICDSIEHRTSYKLCVFSDFLIDTYLFGTLDMGLETTGFVSLYIFETLYHHLI